MGGDLRRLAVHAEQAEHLIAQGDEHRVGTAARHVARDFDDLRDAAWVGVHDGDPVPEVDGLVDVVGDQDRGHALASRDPFQFVLKPQPGQRVQGTQRFVEQEEARLVDQGARDGDPLRHATRQLRRIGVGEPIEADQPQVIGDERPLLGLADPAAAQGRGDVALHVEPGQQPVVLEHDRAVGTRPLHRTAVDPQLAGEIPVEPEDQPQQGRLAAARGADDAQELALPDRKVDVGQYLQGPAGDMEALGEAADLQRMTWHGRCLVLGVDRLMRSSSGPAGAPACRYPD